ncbi:multidrug effflux MFS transporter [Neisseria bacilliformis]|uniref:multidrug effflux MFS transporter n=1 Tax=Neisseria bacilliformis TaxID=267212 RepID=UPI0006693173|nr:multidrug effflux MFS transporter [Neisseria bacilliformis]
MPLKRTLALLLTLSALMAMTSLSTDIYLPAMPVMERTLGGNAELTVTGFLIGFALAQLVWGSVSDRIGRKIPLFAGLGLFIVGSAGCALSQSMEAVVFWRVFQALGACVGPILSRAMIRDLYAGSQAAQMLSTLVIMMAVAPIVGPLLGGAMLKFSSWHAIFWLLAVIGAVLLFAVFRLPETLPADQRRHAPLVQSFRQYAALLTNRRFMRYTLALTFFYMAAYAFIVGSPFVYIEFFGVPTEHYGWLFGVNIVGVVALSFANKSLVRRFSLGSLLSAASLIALVFALGLAAVTYFNAGGLWAVVVLMLGVFSMNGIIAASSTAAALDAVPPQSAGSASALLGSLQYGSGIVSSLLLALFSDGTAWTMGWLIALFVGTSALFASLGRKK